MRTASGGRSSKAKQGSAQGGSDTGKSSCRQRYRDRGSTGLAWLRAAEAGAAVRQEAGRENMK